MRVCIPSYNRLSGVQEKTLKLLKKYECGSCYDLDKNYAYIKKLDLPCLLVQRVACLRSKSTLIQKYFGYI